MLDNGPTANQEHIMPIITILGTNHFDSKEYSNLPFKTIVSIKE
jgi:hypothetical protein